MSATPLSNRRQWLVLLSLTLGVTVTNGFARFAYGLLLPAMQHEMGWGYAQAGWLNTANAFGYILGAVGTMLAIRWVTPAWLFVVGLVSTALALLATGLDAALWWQTVWRVLAGIFGAMSFSTAGALTAGLFANDPRRNALAIAILFGTGGGLGIVLAGAVLPPMLALYGPQWWPMGWVLIGLCSCVFVPLGVWAGWQMRPPPQAHRPTRIPLPKRQMLAMFGGYAGFGLGYIVYLTFLSAWMTAQATSAGFIALVWVVLGLCISLSPVIWRPVFARFSNGVPLCLILLGIAVGSALPVVLPNGPALLISAVVFGLCVFMAPGAVTNFVRQNLPAASWGQAISTFTVVFSVAQTLGPYGAGLVGDMAG
ncbi:MAG: YbfB/YjiJ family MFS transporter, partial [Rhodobacteraceae bacterium]|nr:YbfB/YjiJ family MFS transporter [Paracoccaceae bacterium]